MKFVTYIIGWYDFEKVRIAQKEIIYNKKLYDPFFKLETERLYNIEQHLRSLRDLPPLPPFEEEVMDLMRTKVKVKK